MKLYCDRCNDLITHYNLCADSIPNTDPIQTHYDLHFYKIDESCLYANADETGADIRFTLCKPCAEKVNKFVFGDYTCEIQFREYDRGEAAEVWEKDLYPISFRQP